MISALEGQAQEGPPRMRDLIGAFDWASTPLGARAAWPASLGLAVDLCQRASVPIAVYWGPDFRLIYNDAWAPVLRDRHPAALGRPAAEVWHDLWDLIRPQFEEVAATGEGMSIYEQMLPMRRGEVVEETYWNYSLTPVVGEDGRVAGILNQAIDITKALLAERRLSFQVALADRLRRLSDPEEVKRAATELLGRYLGASRVGYAEIDEVHGTAAVRSDWTRDETTQSLGGHSALISTFGDEALAFLRTGETLAIPDIRAVPLARSAAAEAWEALGMRALITVPLVREGELKALLYVHEPKPRYWKKSEAAIARDVAERTWAAVERAQAEQSLRESEDHYRHTVDLNPQITWTARADGMFDRVAPRWDEWTGTGGLGDSWVESLHPDDRAGTLGAWRRSIETGADFDVEHRLRRRDSRYRWVRSRAFPRRGADGAILLWYGATEDINEKKLAEERQHLLINELNHRVKNILATVQAIAFQTLKGETPLADARGRFEARLMALSRAHSMLTAQNWEGASLDRVVRDATEYLSEDQSRFAVAGAEVWLAPRAALALALAFHELSTNAAKYGALASERGTVSIGWQVADGALRIEWKESGGPLVVAPERRGFGSRLIERGLAADLGGSARLTFEPDGLACTIEAALDTVTARPDLG